MKSLQPSVLIVDDDLQTLETMKLYLSDMAEVYTAEGGRQAIEMVHQKRMDVILLDINMPIMDGLKTLKQLRNLKECIDVSVIMVTGENDKYTVVNAICMGVDGYLVKPVDKENLRQKVLEAYQKKEKKKNKSTVLAIDDDMAYLKVIEGYLGEDYNIIMINSAKLAVDYLMKHTPDVILLDYQMPLYDGAKIMNILHHKLKEPQIPVIILSGVIDLEVLQKCVPFKPAACLAKPASKEILIENIERVLWQ